MKLTVTKKIGRTTHHFQVEGKNLHELLMEAKKLSFNDVLKCGKCESDLLYFNAYVTKEANYKYAKIVCAKCGASITFGQVKATPDVFYLRKTEDKKLDWKDKIDKNQPEQDEDVNF